MKTKKLLSIILTLAMVLVLLPMTISVSAEDTQERRISEFIRPELVSGGIDAAKLTNISSSATDSIFVNSTILQDLDKTLLAGDSLERIDYIPNDTGMLDEGYGEWQDFKPFNTNTGSYGFTMMCATTQKGVPVKVSYDKNGNSLFKFIGWSAGVYTNAGIDLLVNMNTENKFYVTLQGTGAYFNGAELLVADYAYLVGGQPTCTYDAANGTFTFNNLCYCYLDGLYLYILGELGTETMTMNKCNVAGEKDVKTDALEYNDAYLASNNVVIFYVTDASGYDLFRVTSRNTNVVDGTYKWADGGVNYINSYYIKSGSNEKQYFIDGEFTVKTEGDTITLTGYVIGEDNIKYNLNWSYTAPQFGEWKDFDPDGNTGKYLFSAMFNTPVYQKDIPIKVRTDKDGNKQIKFVGWGKGVLTNGNGIDLIVEMDADGKCTVPMQNTGRYWPELGAYIMVEDYNSLLGEEEPCYYDSEIGRFQLTLCYYTVVGSDIYGYSKLENMEIRKTVPERTKVNIESNTLGYNDAYLNSDNAVIFYADDVPGFDFFRVTSNNTDVVDGTYKWSEGGINDINSYFIEKGSQIEGYFQDGEFTVKTEGDTVTLTGYMIGEDEKMYNLNLSGAKPEPQEEPKWSEWEDFTPNGLNKGEYQFTAMFNTRVRQEDIAVKVRTDEDGNKQFKFVGWGKGVFTNDGIDLIVDMDKKGNCTVPAQNTGAYMSLYSAYVTVQDYASLAVDDEPFSYYDTDLNMFKLKLCYYFPYGATLVSCGVQNESMEMTTDRDIVDIADGTLEYDDSDLQSGNTAVFYAADIPGYEEFRIATSNTTKVEGTYKWSDGGIDAENSYFIKTGSQDKVYFCDGEFTVKVYNNAASLTGWLLGTDDKIYRIDMRDKISLTLDGSSFTVTQSGKNKGKGVIIVALYDIWNINKLNDVKVYNISDAAPIEDSFNTDGGYVKAFWWSDFGKMTPFCSPVSETIVK